MESGLGKLYRADGLLTPNSWYARVTYPPESTASGSNTKVVVRALGPSLDSQGISGVLANPTLQLVNANGSTVRANDNWKSDQQAALIAIGIQPTKDAESALIATLPAGSYTAIVHGKNNSNGVGLVEIYNVE